MRELRTRRNSLLFSDSFPDSFFVSQSRDFNGVPIASAPQSVHSSSESSSSSSDSSPIRSRYIVHRVSKMDTLAGVAIKYGVEVSDIKRLNGLVTDLQMFAYKSLQIPLTGRHPPSLCLLNDIMDESYLREQSPPGRSHVNLLDSLQSLKSKPPPCKVSPAMSSLQGFYNLAPPKIVVSTEGTEMAVYRTSNSFLDDEFLPKELHTYERLPNGHHKSRSLFSGFSTGNGEISDENAISNVIDNIDMDRSIRRRQKFDGSPVLLTPELLLKEDTSNALSGRTVKGLALRPKSGTRTDMDTGVPNAASNGYSFVTSGFVSVKKSSSTSSLQHSENYSSPWPTTLHLSKWAFKPDAVARPIFDGFPRPSTLRRNKAALD